MSFVYLVLFKNNKIHYSKVILNFLPLLSINLTLNNKKQKVILLLRGISVPSRMSVSRENSFSGSVPLPRPALHVGRVHIRLRASPSPAE